MKNKLSIRILNILLTAMFLSTLVIALRILCFRMWRFDILLGSHWQYLVGLFRSGWKINTTYEVSFIASLAGAVCTMIGIAPLTYSGICNSDISEKIIDNTKSFISYVWEKLKSFFNTVVDKIKSIGNSKTLKIKSAQSGKKSKKNADVPDVIDFDDFDNLGSDDEDRGINYDIKNMTKDEEDEVKKMIDMMRRNRKMNVKDLLLLKEDEEALEKEKEELQKETEALEKELAELKIKEIENERDENTKKKNSNLNDGHVDEIPLPRSILNSDAYSVVKKMQDNHKNPLKEFNLSEGHESTKVAPMKEIKNEQGNSDAKREELRHRILQKFNTSLNDTKGNKKVKEKVKDKQSQKQHNK